MPKYSLDIQYNSPKYYEEYDPNVEYIVKEKFGEKGASDFEPFGKSSEGFHYSHRTSFSAPSNVPLDELRKVELGYGIRATISERPD